jgi:uncharacterized membrane protein (Fun14 family)
MYMKMINTVLLIYGLMLIITTATCSFIGVIHPNKLELTVILFVVGCALVLWVGIYGVVYCNCSKIANLNMKVKAGPIDDLITLDNILAEKIYKALARWPVKNKKHKIEVIKDVITTHRTK